MISGGQGWEASLVVSGDRSSRFIGLNLKFRGGLAVIGGQW